jgi:hypothetical protein
VSVTGASGEAANAMSPIALFLQADIVVKAVMIGLILASVWTWAIIVAHVVRMRRLAREGEAFERDFWKADDIDRFHESRGKGDIPSARVLAAGIAEWRRSTSGKTIDKEGTRARLSVALHSAVTTEVDSLAARLNILGSSLAKRGWSLGLDTGSGCRGLATVGPPLRRGGLSGVRGGGCFFRVGGRGGGGAVFAPSCGIMMRRKIMLGVECIMRA